jgi:carbon-monoxide dehydrogenase medium subunit
VDYPRAHPGWRYAFHEVARRHGDFAIAGLAAAARVEGGALREARLAFFGVADRPLLVRGANVEELRDRTDKIEVSGTSVYPPSYRRRLVRVLLERVLREMQK